jgi:hypothetical protein
MADNRQRHVSQRVGISLEALQEVTLKAVNSCRTIQPRDLFLVRHELGLRDSTNRTYPVLGNVFERSPGRDSAVGIPCRLVVYVAAVFA